MQIWKKLKKKKKKGSPMQPGDLIQIDSQLFLQQKWIYSIQD